MIVRLYETFEDEKNIYLVQEYLFCVAVFVRVVNSSKDWSSMATLTKKMPANFLRRSSNAYVIYILKRSLTEISNPRTSSWTPRRTLRWKSLILGFLTSGKIICGAKWSQRRRINSSAPPITLLLRYCSWIMTNAAIYGRQESCSTFSSLLPRHLMEKTISKSWRTWRLWNTPSIVLQFLFSSWG